MDLFFALVACVHACHFSVFQFSVFVCILLTFYFRRAGTGFDFSGMLEDLKSCPNGSVILLHSCAHNPTGVDPTEEQWNELLEVSICGIIALCSVFRVTVLTCSILSHNPLFFTLSQVFKAKSLFPLFDNAYQGFVSGDPAVDAYAVRTFVDAGLSLIVASSFSKNFGLYGER